MWKEYLISIANKLDINLPPKFNVPLLCELIESQLIQKELIERKTNTNVRWFYSFWEDMSREHDNYNISSSTK